MHKHLLNQKHHKVANGVVKLPSSESNIKHVSFKTCYFQNTLFSKHVCYETYFAIKHCFHLNVSLKGLVSFFYWTVHVVNRKFYVLKIPTNCLLFPPSREQPNQVISPVAHYTKWHHYFRILPFVRLYFPFLSDRTMWTAICNFRRNSQLFRWNNEKNKFCGRRSR